MTDNQGLKETSLNSLKSKPKFKASLASLQPLRSDDSQLNDSSYESQKFGSKANLPRMGSQNIFGGEEHDPNKYKKDIDREIRKAQRKIESNIEQAVSNLFDVDSTIYSAKKTNVYASISNLVDSTTYYSYPNRDELSEGDILYPKVKPILPPIIKSMKQNDETGLPSEIQTDMRTYKSIVYIC